MEASSEDAKDFTHILNATAAYNIPKLNYDIVAQISAAITATLKFMK